MNLHNLREVASRIVHRTAQGVGRHPHVACAFVLGSLASKFRCVEVDSRTLVTCLFCLGRL